MRALFVLSLAVPLACAGFAPAIAATKTATDHAAKCQAQVPATWAPGEYNIGMKDPAGASNVLISNSPTTDLGLAKQVASSTFTVQKTIEDTPKRYWMAYADRNGKPGTYWYVAINTGSYICAMQLSFDAHLSDADAKAVVDSFKKH